MFSGRVVVERAPGQRTDITSVLCAGAQDWEESWKHFPNRRNHLPRVTHDTFFDIPYDFGIFPTCGSVPQFRFSKLQSRGKHWFASDGVDIYILWKQLIAPNFGFSSQVRLYLSRTDSITSLKLSAISSFLIVINHVINYWIQVLRQLGGGGSKGAALGGGSGGFALRKKKTNLKTLKIKWFL